MRITWEVEDGYIGGSRPQHTDIDEEEFEDCETEEDRQKIIEEAVQQDFDNSISWAITHIDEETP